MFGRERSEGHAADDERVDLAHRRDPAVLADVLQVLLRRQHPPEQGAQLELVAAGVEGRVGQHGDADELQPVEQHAGHVAPAAAAPGLAAAVDVEAQLVGLVGAHRADGVVGADQVAHGAADAGVGRVGLLAHAVVGPGDTVAGGSSEPDRAARSAACGRRRARSHSPGRRPCTCRTGCRCPGPSGSARAGP